MGNRCPDCNKFVGLETGDPEAEEPEVSDGDITASVRVVLNCADCGTEMKEWNAELSGTISQEAEEHLDCNNITDVEHEVSAEWESDPTVEDEYRSRRPNKPKKDGTVRPTPFRYQTHYYQISGSVCLTCSCGVDLGTSDLEDEIEASGFDELN
jgi:BRCT domain type II-containing protein